MIFVNIFFVTAVLLEGLSTVLFLSETQATKENLPWSFTKFFASVAPGLYEKPWRGVLFSTVGFNLIAVYGASYFLPEKIRNAVLAFYGLYLMIVALKTYKVWNKHD